MDYCTSKTKVARYLFRVVGLIFLSVTIAESCYAQVYSSTSTVTITAVVLSTSTPPDPIPPSGGGGSGGGGGGAGVYIPPVEPNHDSAIFKGLAYPGSIVSLLKNGTIITEVPASPNGTFQITVRNLGQGTYTFGIIAEDVERRKSSMQTFSIYLTSDVSTVVEGIFIPPTITTDKTETVRGDPIVLLGKAAPNATVTLVVNSDTQLIKKVPSNSVGTWLYKLDSFELELGDHEGKVRSSSLGDMSPFSQPINFVVGTKNVLRQAVSQTTSSRKCDLNGDTRVNLLDFSIMAFWYKRTGFPLKVDLNNDKKIDLSDVSILAYCWTG